MQTPARPGLRLEVGQLALEPAFERSSAGRAIGRSDLWVEVDLLGLASPSAMRTGRVVPAASGVPVDFGFVLELAVAPGSEEQAVLGEALASADEQDADVYFELKSASSDGPELSIQQVAQGFLNLKALLNGGRDLVDHCITLLSKHTQSAATLSVSLVAVEALGAAAASARKDSHAAPTRQGNHVPPAPRVEAPSSPALSALERARGSAPGTPVRPKDDLFAGLDTQASIRVDVGKLALVPALKADIDVNDLWVEVDLLGLGEPDALRTHRLQKTSAPLNFGYSASFDIAPDSAEQAALRDALTSADEQDADVYFELKTLDARGQERELAQGFVNLRALLAEGRDAVSTSVRMQGKDRQPAATLRVSLVALEALRAASSGAEDRMGKVYEVFDRG